jgi:hypothetical protein
MNMYYQQVDNYALSAWQKGQKGQKGILIRSLLVDRDKTARLGHYGAGAVFTTLQFHRNL